MTLTNADIINAIEAVAPLPLQESYDNSGLQVGSPRNLCSGVMLCVDLTPQVVEEAASRGCSLIIAHHPVLFHPLRSLTGSTPQEVAIIEAIRAGISIYASHTALDNALHGVSFAMASRLPLQFCNVAPLVPLNGSPCPQAFGSGLVGDLNVPITPSQLVEAIKHAFHSKVVRCTEYPADAYISRIAMCGGAGGSMTANALAAGAQAYITSDVRYHDFVDYRNRLFIADISHFESEECTKEIFYHIIKEKFPNFAVWCSKTDTNPINFM